MYALPNSSFSLDLFQLCCQFCFAQGRGAFPLWCPSLQPFGVGYTTGRTDTRHHIRVILLRLELTFWTNHNHWGQNNLISVY